MFYFWVVWHFQGWSSTARKWSLVYFCRTFRLRIFSLLLLRAQSETITFYNVIIDESYFKGFQYGSEKNASSSPHHLESFIFFLLRLQQNILQLGKFQFWVVYDLQALIITNLKCKTFELQNSLRLSAQISLPCLHLWLFVIKTFQLTCSFSFDFD